MTLHDYTPERDILYLLDGSDEHIGNDGKNLFAALKAFAEWLKEVLSAFGGKKVYSDEHICEQIFSDKQAGKTAHKYHVIALIRCAEDIDKELRMTLQNGAKTNDHLVKGTLAYLKDIVLDAYEFIGSCEVQFLKRKPTHQLQRRRLFVSNEIFGCSRNLLRRHFHYDDILLSSVPVFLIRQAIEVKILRSLGVRGVVDQKNSPSRFRLDDVVSYVYSNHNIEIPIKKSVLLKVFSWTNSYIHLGVMDYHWKIHWAHLALEPLFSSGRGTTMMSLTGSIRVDKEFFESRFEQDFLSALGLSSSKIIRITPEAIIEDF